MAQAIMADSFEPSKRGLAFSLYGLVAVLAPVDRTHPGRLDHRQLFLALDLLHQHSRRHSGAVPHQPAGGRSTLTKRPTARISYRIDYIGVSLLVVAMGALQITLDKGEEKNWFGSHFIVALASTFIISFIALIIWEFHVEKPLIDLRLFKFKNFAVCAFLMLLTGGLLNATTVLQPQFLQQQLGYTATVAGLSLSGGGLALLIAMPMAGQAVSRFPARNLIAHGLCDSSLSAITTPPLTLACSSVSGSPPSCAWFRSSPSPSSLFR